MALVLYIDIQQWISSEFTHLMFIFFDQKINFKWNV